MSQVIPGLAHLKAYFPQCCCVDNPCCLASKINLTLDEVNTYLNYYRLPCQQCMLHEIDSTYIDNNQKEQSKFSHHNLTRRVQHYGFRYDYDQKKLFVNGAFNYNTSPMLVNLQVLFSKTFNAQSKQFPNQSIINEYLSRQKIGAHIDSDSFGPVIVTISLLGSTQ
jgi:alkylated DNA repair dioxygenase AlkB